MNKLYYYFIVLLTCAISLNAQDRSISGVVSDLGDDPLPGVNVIVKGSTIGTVTDLDGKYSISVPQEYSTLVYSFIGYAVTELEIGVSNNMDISLNEDLIGLDEVVITALGISRDTRALGYSTQTVGGDDVSRANESNLVNALSGRVAGVQINNSTGAVGGSSRINLRGISTVDGDSQPLFVVNGIPISNHNYSTSGSATDVGSSGSGGFDTPNAAADINPNDIESIEVLKGPSAAALYGVRASNGVIVITTKNGNKNESIGVELNTGVTFQTPLVLPSYQNSYGQGSNNEFFEYINGTSSDGGVDESWGPPLDVGLEFMQFSSHINNPDNPQPEPWVSHPDNIKDFYQTGVVWDNNVALSGGNESSTFRLGFGQRFEEGMIPHTDFTKLSFNGAGSHEFNDKFRANFSAGFTNSKSDNLPSSGYDSANVVQQTIWAGRQVDLQALEDWRNLPNTLPGSTYGEGFLPINWNTQFQNNPYWQLENNRNDFRRNRTLGNVAMEYKLSDKFSVYGQIGLDNYTTLTTTRYAQGSAADAPTYWIFGSSFNRDASTGYYDEQQRTYFETNGDLMLKIQDINISDKLVFGGTFGGGKMYRRTTRDFRGVQLDLPGLYNLTNLAPGSTLVNVNDHAQWGINSLYGVAEFELDHFLYLTFTGRNDWVSVLPLDNNSIFYPSVNLSAVLSDKIQMPSSISFLKVRGGWAEVGGFGPLEPGDIHATYLLSGAPWNGNVFGNFPTTLNNPNIKPQTKTGAEFGVDLNLFRNRIRIGATYYDESVKDMILDVEVSRAAGILQTTANIGEMTNKGFELELGTIIYESKANDLTVGFNLNYGKTENEVVKLLESSAADDSGEIEPASVVLGNTWNMDLQAREGYSMGVIVGPSLSRTASGDVIYENGLPVIGDIKVLGSVLPDWTGGAELTVDYKNFAFSTLIDAKIGGDVYSMTNAWGRYAGILEETMLGRETGIVGDGVKNVGTAAEPIYVENDVAVSAEIFNHNVYGNDIVETSVFDASFIKLREVQLGFFLPDNLVSKIGLQDIKVSVVARNLAFIYKKAPHIDPETSYSNDFGSQGQEFGQLPSARSIGINLNVKF